MNGAQFMRGVDNGVEGVTEIKPYDFNQGFGRLALQCKFLFIHPLFFYLFVTYLNNVTFLSIRMNMQTQYTYLAKLMYNYQPGIDR